MKLGPPLRIFEISDDYDDYVVLIKIFIYPSAKNEILIHLRGCCFKTLFREFVISEDLLL